MSENEQVRGTSASRSKSGRCKKPHRRRKIILLSIECLLLLLLVGVYQLLGFVKNTWENIETPTEDPNIFFGSDETGYHTEAATVIETDTAGETQVYEIDLTEESTNQLESKVAEKMSGYKTFVVIGVDRRDPNASMTYHTQGDVCMIVSLNLETMEVRIASVYRDTLVEASEGYNTKFTNAYCNMGASRIATVLNRNYDLEISDYVIVNWKAVADTINLMGGLDVEMSAKEAEYTNGEIAPVVQAIGVDSTMLEVRGGVQHLDGVQCVAFARIRKVGHSDFQRTERQRYIVNLMLEKAKSMSLSRVFEIIDVVSREIATSFELMEILNLAKYLLQYNITETTGFPFKYQSNDKIYPKNLIANVAELHRFLYGTEDYEPSPNVRRLDDLIYGLCGVR